MISLVARRSVAIPFDFDGVLIFGLDTDLIFGCVHDGFIFDLHTDTFFFDLFNGLKPFAFKGVVLFCGRELSLPSGIGTSSVILIVDFFASFPN